MQNRAPPPNSSGDFASENASPGFKASIPVKAGDETKGPLEGLDPDRHGWEQGGKPEPSAWERFKQTIRDAFNRH